MKIVEKGGKEQPIPKVQERRGGKIRDRPLQGVSQKPDP